MSHDDFLRAWQAETDETDRSFLAELVETAAELAGLLLLLVTIPIRFAYSLAVS